MTERIHIHVDLLTSHIKRLERAMKNVDSCLSESEIIDYTNIKPYVNDLENMLKMIQIITMYKAMFQTDTETLAQVSATFTEQDQQLAKEYHVGLPGDVQLRS